jgi:hypothetical protein
MTPTLLPPYPLLTEHQVVLIVLAHLLESEPSLTGLWLTNVDIKALLNHVIEGVNIFKN